ncbi:hypothetical protein BOV90_12070 [Solemya velum gill symbiont]|uniref:cyclic-guanylate-specific phosphodiesterase n=2 Tax=Solemya velum gill symbiont TaxID=2340 RepID=A0A1T2CVZ6_SOVGS|nr:GGDEF domain-containing phosphodiesterase [Solemya velum gill symbiont]OOY35197.1 hypothetical protein BOV88_05600 [Solemya velum gill symbiont]OOY37898.1 hypothetical protein BOV89_04515 [Solemya velum gill symbiont]OOY38921.1 hypothetical protein BOV90_12070 [Solemya velum gill symbiont]OOY48296.1 hypothetical protein BOV93_04140 [Solemya velum gill symbiont]OOY51721.1 hypothetical protein BOV94_04230 [Solemya velum gill symbiont]
MNNQRIDRLPYFLLFVLVVLSTFGLAVLWEHWLEPYILHLLGKEAEEGHEKWRYVITTTSFVMLSLIFPFWLAMNKEKSRMTMSEELTQSERRWRFALDGAGDGVWDWNPQTDEATFSKNWNAILGYEENEFPGTGSAVFGAIHPDDLEYVQQGIQDYMYKGVGTSYSAEFRMQTKNGDWKWVSARGKVVVRDADNNPVRMIGTHSDISDRKQSEQQIQIAATAFESQQGMMITDAEIRILQVNSAFCEMSGYSAEEVIGNTPRMFQSGRHDAAFYKKMWNDINNDGSWHVEIWDKRKDGEVYPKLLTISAVTNDEGEISHFVGVHTDITERKEAEEKIEHLAFYDQLTGLPNRTLLMDRLDLLIAAGKRHNQYNAILMIDLDHFKNLNDTRGHDIGDELLAQVAKRLKSSTRAVDTVARLGGDEFVILLAELPPEQMKAANVTEVLTEKVLNALGQNYTLHGFSHHSTASIGISLFDGETISAETLLKQADLAMYKSKSAGRNRISFYDPEMQASVHERVALETALRSAFDNEEYVLHYQPQVSLLDGRLIGVEALLRWNRPRHGLVSPDQFIPVLEETGLITDVSYWVLQESCKCLKRWHDSGFDHLRMAINISPVQFKNKNFLAIIEKMLQEVEVSPSHVELEIAEGTVMDDPQYAESLLNDLHNLGLEIAIDDFGTGYSSLSSLMDLPFDTLKIDRAFIKGLPENKESASFCEAIIALAKALKLQTVAEGVEEVSQLQFLNRIGCTIMQGFYFSKPFPSQEIEKMLFDGVRLSVSDRRADFLEHQE